jgi:hypothetical protein
MSYFERWWGGLKQGLAIVVQTGCTLVILLPQALLSARITGVRHLAQQVFSKNFDSLEVSLIKL